MQGKKIIIASTLCLAATSAMAFHTEQQSVPNLPDYFAQKPPRPPLKQRIKQDVAPLRGLYITGIFGWSFEGISNIKYAGDMLVENATETPNITSVHSNVTHGGIAIGYMFKPSGPFSRVDVEYIYRGKINYNANPILSNTGFESTDLQSSIQNQTVLVNTFYDFNFGDRIIPYIQAGVGASWNAVKLKSFFEANPADPVVTENRSTTTTNFSADGGVGVRVKLTRNLYFDANYQFVYLGRVKWRFSTDIPPGQPPFLMAELKTSKYYTQDVNIGITLQIT